MSIVTSQIVQETDLVGTLTSSLSTTGLTVTAIFRDKKTGVARTPQATTLMFDIDQDNSSHETILADSHSTASGVTTITLNASGRNLPKYGVGAGSGTGLSHVVGASIGCVNIARPMNQLADQSASKSGDTITGDIIFSSTTKGGLRVNSLTTVQRDALGTVANGYIIYNTTDGEYQNYNAGTWYSFAAGSTQPDASETVAGKVEQATLAEQGASTEAGDTGAPLFVNPKNLVKTSSGAGDENKVAMLNSSGKFAEGFLNHFTAVAGENLTAGQSLYIKASDGKAYKTTAAAVGEAVESFCGFALATTTAAATVTILTGPHIYGLTGLTAGSVYYLADTAGTISTTSGTVVKAAGFATSTTSLYMFPPANTRVFVYNGVLTNPATVNSTADTTVTVGWPVKYMMFSAYMYISDAAGTNPYQRLYPSLTAIGTQIGGGSNFYHIKTAPATTFVTQTLDSSVNVLGEAGTNRGMLTLSINSITASTVVFRLTNALSAGSGSANGQGCIIKAMFFG